MHNSTRNQHCDFRSLRRGVFSAAVLALVFMLGAGPVRASNAITKSFTFSMPACPIPATTVPPTKTEFSFPDTNILGDAHSVTGTIQVTDQTSSSVILLEIAADANLSSLDFARTVKTLQHATGQLTFDKGCTKTDPYGSNNCHWTWGQTITAAYQGALQEDIQAGKLIVDLKIDNTIPFVFSCPVCGAECTVHLPEQADSGRWDQIWRLMIRIIQFPLSLTNPQSSD